MMYKVPNICGNLLPPTNVMMERFRTHLNTSRAQTEANRLVHEDYVNQWKDNQVRIMEGYRGTRDVFVSSEHMGGTL